MAKATYTVIALWIPQDLSRGTLTRFGHRKQSIEERLCLVLIINELVAVDLWSRNEPRRLSQFHVVCSFPEFSFPGFSRTMSNAMLWHGPKPGWQVSSINLLLRYIKGKAQKLLSISNDNLTTSVIVVSKMTGSH